MTSQNTGEATSARVAELATRRDGIDLRGMAILGVFGAESDMTALVRMRNGDIERVQRGTRIGRARVAGIDAQGVVLERGGRMERLALP